MAINGIGNSAVTAAASYSKAAEQTKAGKTEETSEVKKTQSKSDLYKKNNAETIEALKAEVDRQTESLRSLVEKMIGQQGQTLAKADAMWSFIAGGNYNVDAATKKAAQEAISDDGYWGVEQTSQRIVDFAKSLTGGDKDKIEQMRSAIEKGFAAATKSWGKTLPDISSKTHDAIMKKLDDWAKEED